MAKNLEGLTLVIEWWRSWTTQLRWLRHTGRSTSHYCQTAHLSKWNSVQRQAVRSITLATHTWSLTSKRASENVTYSFSFTGTGTLTQASKHHLRVGHRSTLLQQQQNKKIWHTSWNALLLPSDWIQRIAWILKNDGNHIVTTGIVGRQYDFRPSNHIDDGFKDGARKKKAPFRYDVADVADWIDEDETLIEKVGIFEEQFASKAKKRSWPNGTTTKSVSTWATLEVFAFGQIGLMLSQFYDLLPREWGNLVDGWNEKENRKEQAEWERTRWQTTILTNGTQEVNQGERFDCILLGKEPKKDKKVWTRGEILDVINRRKERAKANGKS